LSDDELAVIGYLILEAISKPHLTLDGYVESLLFACEQRDWGRNIFYQEV
jgi:hypothetical protein